MIKVQKYLCITKVNTDHGLMDFLHQFDVRRRCDDGDVSSFANTEFQVNLAISRHFILVAERNYQLMDDDKPQYIG